MFTKKVHQPIKQHIETRPNAALQQQACSSTVIHPQQQQPQEQAEQRHQVSIGPLSLRDAAKN